MSAKTTQADALADPTSNLNRSIDKARETMSKNDEVIAQWIAKGLTHEEAWHKALFG